MTKQNASPCQGEIASADRTQSKETLVKNCSETARSLYLYTPTWSALHSICFDFGWIVQACIYKHVHTYTDICIHTHTFTFMCVHIHACTFI